MGTVFLSLFCFRGWGQFLLICSICWSEDSFWTPKYINEILGWVYSHNQTYSSLEDAARARSPEVHSHGAMKSALQSNKLSTCALAQPYPQPIESPVGHLWPQAPESFPLCAKYTDPWALGAPLRGEELRAFEKLCFTSLIFFFNLLDYQACRKSRCKLCLSEHESSLVSLYIRTILYSLPTTCKISQKSQLTLIRVESMSMKIPKCAVLPFVEVS